jgi:type II secretory pathway pseudopilin PulG
MLSGSPKRRALPAMTLIELTVVLCILMALIGTSLMVTSKISDWRLGRDAAETLRTVYAAQRMYLADNPTVAVSSITGAQLIPYLPNKAVAMPTVTSLTKQPLAIKVDVFPPVVNDGSNNYYDPSRSRTDNLWDVGE